MINEHLPKSWIECCFEDVGEGENSIVDGPFGSNLKLSDYINDPINGIPVLSTKNLEGNYSDNYVRFISKEKFTELKRSQVKPGDILVAKIGSIGKNGIYPLKAKIAMIPANLLKFTVSSKIVFKYVHFYLNFFELQNKIKDISTATAQPAFNVTKFRKLKIPLPPLPEQHHIIAKIEELFSELDKGVENLKKVQEQLKVYRQAVLKWAFEGRFTNDNVKDGELPDGWEWKKIKEVAKCNPKLPFFPISEDMEVTFLPMRNVEEVKNKIDLSLIKKYSEVKKGFTPMVNDDVIFAKITPCMENGKIAIVHSLKNKIAFGSTEFHVFRCNDGFFNRYLLHFLLQEKTRINAEQNMTGAVGQRRVPKSYLEELEIPVPKNLNEQIETISQIESRLSVCDKIEETIAASLQQAEALRQSILKKAFEGKLVPQDPNDEPASVLLEKIKVERMMNGNGSKRSKTTKSIN